MKSTLQFSCGQTDLTLRIAALVLALASANIGSAQLNNTTNGPKAAVTNGTNAGASMATGDDNSAYGFSALQFTTTGIRNTAVGSLALKNNTAGNNNTAVGYGALTVSLASGNTALGSEALFQNTTGTLNTASGGFALFNNTAGSFNTATGRDALRNNTSGGSNVAAGHQALYENTSGGFNVAIGDGALLNNTTGSGNIALGEDAGYHLTVGDNNISIGNKGVAGESGIIRLGTDGTHTDTWLTGVIHGDGSGLTGLSAASVTGTFTTAQIADAAVTSAKLAPDLILNGNLTFPTTTATSGAIFLNGVPFLHGFGSLNVFVGPLAGNRTMSGLGNTAVESNSLAANTTAGGNTALGWSALNHNTTGGYNTASGVDALYSNTAGEFNTSAGFRSLYFNTTGSENTASGYYALLSNTIGSNNTASGVSALASNTTGNDNTAIGKGALGSNTTGSANIALGKSAGAYLNTGDNNIDIGNRGVAGESNTIRIGVQDPLPFPIPGSAPHTATYIAGISGATAASGVAVYVGPNGKLGTLTSSRRFKQDIASMDGASDALLSLRPVTFRYKTDLDPQGIPQFGLIAEEVDKVAPELVARDDHGEIYTVRYEAVNAMLLNEFLKEHRRVDAQAKTIAEQEKRFSAQEATIKAQTQAIAEQAQHSALQEQTIAGQTKVNAEQQTQIRVLATRLAEVTQRIEKMAQRMDETKAPAMRKAMHRPPGSF